ncbi:MAG: outer membrane protein assembly factor BamB family protein, partial [Planctomycetota bacterium]
ALAPRSGLADWKTTEALQEGSEPDSFERGPAYDGRGDASGDRRPATDPSADWPTFRHDPLRSGATGASVPAELVPCWNVAVGGRISPPVVAGEKVFVAAVDEHRLDALRAADGTRAWSFTAGGRIDTPPTVFGDRVLFGSADGWAYCVRASDGRLAWRRRAAPEERLVGVDGQLESAWPVHGNVLVQNGTAYLAAGRSSYLDGGILLYALDPHSGDVLETRAVRSLDPKTDAMPPGDARTIPGALADVLTSDGASVYMRQMQVFGGGSPAAGHLVSTGGFRDDTWFNRTQWAVGAVAGAQLLVFDERVAYGVAAYPGRSRAHAYHPGQKGYLLFAGPWRSPPKTSSAGRRGASAGKGSRGRLWEIRVPVRVTAMALAGDKLLAAGPPDVVDPNDPLAAFEGRRGGKLLVVSAADGNVLAEHEMPGPPIFDGMAVAGGRLYVALADGRLACFSGE